MIPQKRAGSRAERALGDELEALAHSVNAYADRLEQADDWLAKRM